MGSWLHCRCGGLIHTNSFTGTHSYQLIADKDYDSIVENDPIDHDRLSHLFFSLGTSVYRCAKCGRLAVEWDPAAPPAFYLPEDEKVVSSATEEEGVPSATEEEDGESSAAEDAPVAYFGLGVSRWEEKAEPSLTEEAPGGAPDREESTEMVAAPGDSASRDDSDTTYSREGASDMTDAEDTPSPWEDWDDERRLKELEAIAEAEYSEMYDSRNHMGCYARAKDAFRDAIMVADRLGREADVKRLLNRLQHVKDVYRSQFC